MIASEYSPRIAIFGPEEPTSAECRGCSLWEAGYVPTLSAAGAVPVYLGEKTSGRSWAELLEDVEGVVWTGGQRSNVQATSEEERLCSWCRKNNFPLLAVDHALHLLNGIHGGSLHMNLASERPEAIQHRHPPEKGLRHAIEVVDGTHLSAIYGEGELVVNSEHRRGIGKVAKGFRVSGKALDGVVEAIEAVSDQWFALGVQWRPASASASGLDIQLFRGLIDACQRLHGAGKRQHVACTTAA
jgi:putative glutamine amidotransferase